MQGFISTHRRLLDNPIMRKPNYLAIWMYLLLKANHKDREIFWNGEITIVRRSELITSIKGIAEYFSLGIATVSRILRVFQSEKMIEKSSNNKFTLVRIINYEKYQITNKEIKTAKPLCLSYVETKSEKTETKKTAEPIINKGRNEFEFGKRKPNGNQAETNNNDNNIIYIAPLQKFINETLPTVSKMKKQLTNKQINELSKSYSIEQIKSKLEEMENYRKIKNYTSVYLTLKNWLKRTPQNTANEILKAY